jgi:hypothetical protein
LFLHISEAILWGIKVRPVGIVLVRRRTNPDVALDGSWLAWLPESKLPKFFKGGEFPH